MKNRGSIYLGILVFAIFVVIFLMFFGIIMFQTIFMGELNTIKNDLYLINRNVLLEMQRDYMGEDINCFYEKNVKNRVQEEIKRQWNADATGVTEKGYIYRAEVIEAKIINVEEKMYIKSKIKIYLRPVIFNEILKDKMVFEIEDKVKVEKMKGW